MNIAHITPDSNVSFRETGPSAWVVSVAGTERTITFDERGFIAWIGHQSRHWCFDHAVKACVEDAEHQRDMFDRQQALRREWDRQHSALSPKQFASVLAAREQELSQVAPCSGRAEMLREDIQRMKEFANVHA